MSFSQRVSKPVGDKKPVHVFGIFTFGTGSKSLPSIWVSSLPSGFGIVEFEQHHPSETQT